MKYGLNLYLALSEWEMQVRDMQVRDLHGVMSPPGIFFLLALQFGGFWRMFAGVNFQLCLWSQGEGEYEHLVPSPPPQMTGLYPCIFPICHLL